MESKKQHIFYPHKNGQFSKTSNEDFNKKKNMKENIKKIPPGKKSRSIFRGAGTGERTEPCVEINFPYRTPNACYSRRNVGFYAGLLTARIESRWYVGPGVGHSHLGLNCCGSPQVGRTLPSAESRSSFHIAI